MADSELRLRWTKLGTSRHKSYALQPWTVTLIGHLVFAFGSRNIFGRVLNVKTRKWAKLSSFPTENRSHHAAVLAEDKVYFYGGRHSISGSYPVEMMEYDILQDEFSFIGSSALESPGAKRSLSAAFAEHSRDILVFGGRIPDTFPRFCNRIHAFNIDRKAWRELKCGGSRPQARKDHASVIVGQKWYIFGGNRGSRQAFNDLWVADLSNLSKVIWSRLPHDILLPDVSQVSLNYMQGRLVLFGGWRRAVEQPLNEVFVFSTREKIWKSRAGTVQGDKPQHKGRQLSVHFQKEILYFTTYGEFMLSQDE